MSFPPKYTKTARIRKLLQNLNTFKAAFSLVPITPKLSLNIRRTSLLKSSLFSARIEGNPLKLEDITQRTLRQPTSLKKREIVNILRALEFIYSKSPKIMTLDLLKQLHTIVLANISSEAGQFRTEVSAIFNMASVAIYLTPPPNKINELISVWSQWCNTNSEPGPIQAALAHFGFEKIHPFLDGNGRVGRLIMSWILTQSGYDFGGVVSFEEYLDEHRQEDYDGLNTNINDITEFVEFFLVAYEAQVQKALELIKNPPPQIQSNLLPRRQEILDTIRDHNLVSFDFIWRRFQAVPKSTLHNDLKQLIKGSFIKKLGTTRGVVYTNLND